MRRSLTSISIQRERRETLKRGRMQSCTSVIHLKGPLTEKHPPAVQTRPFRTAALCLGVLCFLMIIGIIFLSVQCKIKYNTQQLLSTKYRTNSVLKWSHLHASKALDSTVNYISVTLGKDELQEKISGKSCPEGWKKFGCSCYFTSNEWTNWGSSREYCQKRGANLVVINNKEEQEFVIQLNINGESWIGLREIKENWMQGRWQWVDGSPLSET
ncbi:C-type lectin domain family 6 member A-like [Sebastes umbrosus]|uniref:C-type lectin domain family 6 member A-like n=1 Tax=Sebastes umbrosus TaxID=72105 RepID=UPI0018A014F2|nr:C-type lectin domain family 6 member A-like [Sebastes umbrosus]